MTPRQACPRPNGFGRNLRSKTRWFTGFCNSHQVSHFATFFIDARAEISIAESHSLSCCVVTAPRDVVSNSPGAALNSFGLLGARGRRGLCLPSGSSATHGRRPATGGEGKMRSCQPPAGQINMFPGQTDCEHSTMILPQVHLRKPCYDFSFL